MPLPLSEHDLGLEIGHAVSLYPTRFAFLHLGKFDVVVADDMRNEELEDGSSEESGRTGFAAVPPDEEVRVGANEHVLHRGGWQVIFVSYETEALEVVWT